MLLHDAREGGNERNVRVSPPVWRGRNAYVHRVDASWLAAPAALKQCRRWTTGDPDSRAARRQFDALVKVDAAMGREGQYRVPEPIVLFEDAACHLVAWVNGVSLERALSRPSAGTSAARLMVGSGAWLRHFHAVGRLPDGRLDVAKQLADLEAIRRNARRWPVSLEAGYATLRASAPRVSGISVAQSWVHGDCKPANLFLDGECYFGLDVHADNGNVVAFDVAQFLNGLAMIGGWRRSQRLAAHVPELEEAFWEGYGVSAASELGRVVAWLRAVLLLSSWSEFQHGIPGMIRRAVHRRIYDRTVESVVQQLLI